MADKILVTGADGFIGSHLVEKLVRDGFMVKAFVMYTANGTWGWLDSLPADVMSHVEVFVGDVRDEHAVNVALRDCSTVLHLAALIGIPFSYYSPSTYLQVNVQGTLNVLQAGLDLGLERVVCTSTSEVYGTAQYVPMDERHPLNAQSPYAATKVAADQIALSFHRSFGLPLTIIRPFNTFGPRQSARAIIPTVITQLLSGKLHLDLGNLSPTRDFTYVSDTIDGFVKAIAAVGLDGKTINLGSNFEISIEDLVTIIAKICDKEFSVSTDPNRLRPKLSEVERLWSDNTVAKQMLGWEPKFSGSLAALTQGLEKTVDWFSDRSNLARYKAGIYNI